MCSVGLIKEKQSITIDFQQSCFCFLFNQFDIIFEYLIINFFVFWIKNYYKKFEVLSFQ